GTVYLSSGATMTPHYTTDSENLVISFQTKLEDANDSFSFDFSNFKLSYSSAGTSYLYRDSTEIISSDSHPIDNLNFSNIKIISNHGRISIWIDGNLFMSGVDSLDLPPSPHDFSWESLGTGVYIDNISIVGQDKEKRLSSSSTTLILPLNEGEDDSAHDISGNGVVGDILQAEWVDGELYLDANAWIDLPTDLGYTNEVSAFAWFKAVGSPPGGYHIIFGGQELEISIPQSTGEIRTGVYTNSRYVSNHGSGLVDGNWHHLGFTFDGSCKKSYIDGQFV
ncbi:unnamed protein product, partial [marine sediment metagenome]